MRKTARHKHRPGALRIIGGRWRGRRIALTSESGLRPTGDRVRETLFNWLQGHTAGANCLDLFAGSGALGLEALSRGARSVTFVESNTATLAQLEQTAEEFAAEDVQLVKADALAWLTAKPRQYELIFADPPFSEVDLGNLCKLLAAGWVAPGALVYLEMPRSGSLPAMPAGWGVKREQTAGQVRFALLSCPS